MCQRPRNFLLYFYSEYFLVILRETKKKKISKNQLNTTNKYDNLLNFFGILHLFAFWNQRKKKIRKKWNFTATLNSKVTQKIGMTHRLLNNLVIRYIHNYVHGKFVNNERYVITS